jgi:type IV fimbrial biogenesis protein FimT
MKQQGFTLIELIIVCAIVAIVSFSLTSSYTSFIDRAHENKDISRLLLMIRTTRLYSINHASTSVLCPSTDQSNCIRNWKLPLILFIDENKNKKRDDNEPIISRFEPFSADNISINYPKTQIRFNEGGMANYYNGTLSYCLNQSATGIVISRLGRIRFALDLDGDHIPDVNHNTPIICQ